MAPGPGGRVFFFCLSFFHKTLLTRVPIILKCGICEGRGLNTGQDVGQGSGTIFSPSIPGLPCPGDAMSVSDLLTFMADPHGPQRTHESKGAHPRP